MPKKIVYSRLTLTMLGLFKIDLFKNTTHAFTVNNSTHAANTTSKELAEKDIGLLELISFHLTSHCDLRMALRKLDGCLKKHFLTFLIRNVTFILLLREKYEKCRFQTR